MNFELPPSWEPARHLLQSRAALCYHIEACGSARKAPLGGTRFGGTPDLPVGTEWPRDEDGLLANFFAQLDLADLAARAPYDDKLVQTLPQQAQQLPRSGLLSLFMMYYLSAADPVQIKAIYTPPSTPLVRHAAPESEDELADSDTGLLKPVQVQFKAALGFPFHDARFCLALEELCPNEDLYELREFLEPENEVMGQWLGYATPGDDTDFYRALYFHRIGKEDLQYVSSTTWEDYQESIKVTEQWASKNHNTQEKQDQVRWMLDHQSEIDLAVSQWCMLLRIDSNHPMRFSMNDWDPIYFFVPISDLAQGNFSRMEGGVTQS